MFTNDIFHGYVEKHHQYRAKSVFITVLLKFISEDGDITTFSGAQFERFYPLR